LLARREPNQQAESEIVGATVFLHLAWRRPVRVWLLGSLARFGKTEGQRLGVVDRQGPPSSLLDNQRRERGERSAAEQTAGIDMPIAMTVRSQLAGKADG